MSDFNSDNAKLDAALKGLADKTGLRILVDETATESARRLDFSVANVDWSRWKTLYIYASGLVTEGKYQLGFVYNDGLFYFVTPPAGYTGAVRMILYPLCSGETQFHGLLLRDSGSYYSSTAIFQNVTHFALNAVNADAVMTAGSRLRILADS